MTPRTNRSLSNQRQGSCQQKLRIHGDVQPSHIVKWWWWQPTQFFLQSLKTSSRAVQWRLSIFRSRAVYIFLEIPIGTWLNSHKHGDGTNAELFQIQIPRSPSARWSWSLLRIKCSVPAGWRSSRTPATAWPTPQTTPRASLRSRSRPWSCGKWRATWPVRSPGVRQMCCCRSMIHRRTGGRRVALRFWPFLSHTQVIFFLTVWQSDSQIGGDRILGTRSQVVHSYRRSMLGTATWACLSMPPISTTTLTANAWWTSWGTAVL